ncbi:glycosyltransferase family 4 protein [Amaricoccus macauensis]|uniref:glycosyltransferase family 4 protein n=1 Tax=Amaricoccus macauensis TaxID=57001 RepID=UPI003C7CB8BB
MPVESVLIVYDFAEINGGQAKVAIDSSRLLADRGIDVTFFAACGPEDPALDHPKITVENLGQADILNEKSRLKAMARGIWNPEARKRLRQRAASMDPETTVLHCHGYAKALSPSIGPELVSGPLKSVYTMHEYFLACPNGGFYDYQKNEICTRKALSASCLTTNCDVRHPAHKVWRVARQAATWGPGRMPRGLRDVIYISETQKRAMAGYMGPRTRMHHVPNPVPLQDLEPVRASENDIFLFIGRFNPEKGAAIFAEAARKVGVRAVFIGDGAETEAIRAVNPDAELVGWKSPAEVQDWIGRARALVFPSLWYEGQPLVPLEALARGVPVVCGTWSAAVEHVEDGINGIHYTEPGAAALADALDRVKTLPNFDPAPVREAVDPEQHYNRLISVYNGLLEQDV